MTHRGVRLLGRLDVSVPVCVRSLRSLCARRVCSVRRNFGRERLKLVSPLVFIVFVIPRTPLFPPSFIFLLHFVRSFFLRVHAIIIFRLNFTWSSEQRLGRRRVTAAATDAKRVTQSIGQLLATKRKEKTRVP